jgi:SAM-dependent methyltransferase
VRRNAVDVYGAGLLRGGIRARVGGGSPVHLPVERWLGAADAADEEVVGRALGPVLDIGCGPGRHLAALTQRGVYALGIDVSGVAIALARQRGAHAVHVSVFGDVPHPGRWRTALLLDGNVGIGARPVALLRRVRELLVPGGELLVELDDDSAALTLNTQLESEGLTSGWFEWALVGVGAIESIAGASGFSVAERWRTADRWFARLTRASLDTGD